ncbi:reverse transcriptase [Gossypium australe]|uniref:Reverse transcriptase n=1 Tax=Gossypium australe TaxID=47621 RepID=A0A5B6X335_9ROSI|nr:reverse transcriptase [Gossypium australe]
MDSLHDQMMSLLQKKEHVNAITLRSGKTLDKHSAPIQKNRRCTKVCRGNPRGKQAGGTNRKGSQSVVEPVISNPSMVKIPFPSRLEDKQRWEEADFISFINLFKSLNVNLPLLELTDKIPKYAKYLKEIMLRHKKLKNVSKLILMLPAVL